MNEKLSFFHLGGQRFRYVLKNSGFGGFSREIAYRVSVKYPKEHKLEK